MNPIAITRCVSPRFAECELTHLERSPIDLDVARAQHAGYTEALRSLSCQIIELPALEEFPDSVFVEDTALILPEVAVITRPGAASRRGETAFIKQALSPYRELVEIHEPARVDGGDVLVLDRHIYVGLSTRSGQPAIQQMQAQIGRFGYQVSGVPLRDCLHLKSAVTHLSGDLLLLNPHWVDPSAFEGFRYVEIDPGEPFAANVLMIGEGGIYPSAFPATLERLHRHGIGLITVDVSEIAKAEGAVTCCSLILE